MASDEQKQRSIALSAFTRNHNSLKKLIDDEAPKSLVCPQYEKLRKGWEKLEEAHDKFISVTEIDIDTDKNGLSYIDDANSRYDAIVCRYSSYLKTSEEVEFALNQQREKTTREAEEASRQKTESDRKEEKLKTIKEQKQEKFDAAVAQLQLSIESFHCITSDLSTSLETSSLSQKKDEWQRLQQSFESLQKHLVAVAGIDPSQDLTVIQNEFKEEVEKPFFAAKKWVMNQMKDDTAPVSLSTNDSSTRRELVKLPFFKGDDKENPFLNYPVWRKQWDILITDYPERYRSTLLYDHMDKFAQTKFIGFESDYNKTLQCLKDFYGDKVKVVAHVMKEVNSPREIIDGDYEGLISYGDILHNNFSRLKALDIEHEMSNTSTMSNILRKLPRSVSEKWAEYISSKSSSIKERPFPEFIVWLNSMKPIWEQMSLVDPKPKKSAHSNYSESEVSEDSIKCFNCGGTGHMSKVCPSKRANQKLRGKPKFKKFWCAYHKDDVSSSCWSNSCQRLRKMTDANKRVQLLRDNGDCEHCCGDHESDKCSKKTRVCGGGQAGRGCGQSHCLHELLCIPAKVCFSIQNVHTSCNEEEGVLLLIMNVQTSKRGGLASVFWDYGSSSNFVRESFAKKCGFKGRRENLSITTLGGQQTDYQEVITYTCTLKALDGTMHEFQAYGIESITGALTKIDINVIPQVFPHLDYKTISRLRRADKVDFLIGMKNPSWHPERAEKAQRDGDLWLYRGRFGACLGGRHPLIKEGTRPSNTLFVVHHVHHAIVSHLPVRGSHELEFCPARIAKSVLAGDSVPQYPDVPISTQDSVPNESTTQVSIPPSVCSDDTVISVSDMLDTPKGTNTSPITLTSSESSTTSIELEACNTHCLSNLVADYPTCQCITDMPVDVETSPSSVFYSAKSKTSVLPERDMFFHLENLGVLIDPRCGSCQCKNCPIPGSKYSFKEQKEYDLIEKNLVYDESNNCWITEYPWKVPRSTLPRNENSAMQCLLSFEKRLSRDTELAQDFCEQIEGMVTRGAAVILSEEEVSLWKGDYFYLPLVGVKQPKKKWLRVCYDASRKQEGGVSMNDCICKGPDRFVNDLMAVILGFRNGRVAAAADLSKFHNQVRLTKEDVHMQRFFWREMRTEEKPKTYAVQVNNFGLKPANCIATVALHKSADMFKGQFPKASQAVKEQTYIDDELVADLDMVSLQTKTKQMDQITHHAGMHNKGWTFSGDADKPENVQIGKENVADGEERVLGLLWDPKVDVFKFNVQLKLKFSEEDKLVDVLISTVKELDSYSDKIVLTRRILLSNISKIFDPLGFLCPVTLQSKLLLRETWSDRDVGWDDPLPPEQSSKWLEFLKSLLELNYVQVLRSLWPKGEVIGLPLLIIFSDGSISAYGVAAYVRWELRGGGFWTYLIMSKSKISPKRIISIPRMELCGALVGNRIKNFITKETNLQFGKIYHLVDSSTVLGYVHKESGNFGAYEGIRIAEIQSSNNFDGDRLAGWAWVPGCHNPADWCTKPRVAKDIYEKEFFHVGPPFLKEKEEDWPIKLSYRTDKLDGEIGNKKQAVCSYVGVTFANFISHIFVCISSWIRIVRVFAWILRLSFPKCTRPSGVLSCDELKNSKKLLTVEVQKEIADELELASESGKGRFRKLAPAKDDIGIWRVGNRIRSFVPFTEDSNIPVVLPSKHRMTYLIMIWCHNFSHSGIDGTISRFHSQGYWTVRAGKLAKYVKNHCILCRRISKITISQPLGEIPFDRLNAPVAWGFCQLDLFGPYQCRGDVNPRTTKKTWGMIIEDVNSGAVHIDIIQDYSAQAVLLTLRRFGALRGWPGTICSDPGSQLESASGKLESWWVTLEEPLRSLASSKNFKWDISPADSPWRQGKAERRISIVKKLLTLSIGDSRITPVELQTVFFEGANICNERPIGITKPRDDGTYALVTPNHLLMGRSSNILPDDAQLIDNLPMASRYRIVHHITSNFWIKWAKVVSPGLVHRQKWHVKGRNLQINDVVMICEPSKVKAKYRLGTVDAVKVSRDGCVRSATIRYVIVHKDRVQTIKVNRSVQRLCLILPVEEQCEKIEVKEDEVGAKCVASGGT